MRAMGLRYKFQERRTALSPPHSLTENESIRLKKVIREPPLYLAREGKRVSKGYKNEQEIKAESFFLSGSRRLPADGLGLFPNVLAYFGVI